jgi:group I intron endonuclease
MYKVYVIINKVNRKLYVGKCGKSIENRWRKHLLIAGGGKKKYPRLFFALHSAISKYGYNNFDINELQTYASEHLAFEGETEYIRKFKLDGYILYNLTNGGDGASGAKRSKKSKLKMSLAHRRDDYIGGKQILNVSQVKEIKRLLTDNKMKMQEIANLFSVNFQIISNINRGKTWSWVDDPAFKKAKRIPNRKLSEEDIENIIYLLTSKVSYRKIALQFNVSVGCIQKIKSKQTSP